MDELETIRRDFTLEKEKYEQQEDEIVFNKKKDISMLEDLLEETHYTMLRYLNQIDPDSFNNGKQVIDRLCYEVEEEAEIERKKIAQLSEELEETYYRNLKKIGDEQ